MVYMMLYNIVIVKQYSNIETYEYSTRTTTLNKSKKQIKIIKPFDKYIYCFRAYKTTEKRLFQIRNN
jgi:hypothetical protein